MDVGEALVSATPISDPQRRTEFKLAVEAVSPGLFTAIRARLRSGRLPDQGHGARAERVVALGPNAPRSWASSASGSSRRSASATRSSW